MRPVVVFAALVATATASPFGRIGFPGTKTSAAAKETTRDSSRGSSAHHHYSDENRQHFEHDDVDEEDENSHRTVKLTHHRLPLHGDDFGLSYRLQRSNNNPSKAVVYTSDQSSSSSSSKVNSDNRHSRKSGHRHRPRDIDAAESAESTDAIEAAALTRPPACEPMSPPPDEAATKARFDQFAKAFLVTKNITEAFTYIAESYINHNPAAKNGAASAWGILSPIWASQSITVLRTTFKGNQGWLNYRAGGLGEVVDRYRWDAGCIMEHWDQGEKYPSS